MEYLRAGQRSVSFGWLCFRLKGRQLSSRAISLLNARQFYLVLSFLPNFHFLFGEKMQELKKVKKNHRHSEQSGFHRCEVLGFIPRTSKTQTQPTGIELPFLREQCLEPRDLRAWLLDAFSMLTSKLLLIDYFGVLQNYYL